MADITFKQLSKSDARNQAITILQGTSVVVAIQPTDENDTPIPTTGFTLAGQFKSNFDARTPVLSFREDNGSVVNDTDNNQFLLTFSSSATSAVKFTGDSLEGVYDFELTAPDGTKTRVLYGPFTLMREVTV